jgi:hypothetical protein
VRYTEALTDAARRLYETAPDYSFRASDLAGLHRLADLVGAAPEGVRPRADLLHDFAQEVLGHPPAPRDVEGLTKLAEHLDGMGGRRDFEPPADALHRAAGDRLWTLPGPETTRRAIDLLTEGRPAAHGPAGEHPGTAPHADGPTRPDDPAHVPSDDHQPTHSDPEHSADAAEQAAALTHTDIGGGGASFDPFWRGVERHVEAHAQRRGTSSAAEMQQFVLQRALARIFDTHPDDWLLKGGQIFLARNDMARASSDIDLTRYHGDDSPNAMSGDYMAALERDFGDQLTFVPVQVQPLFHFPGVRIRHMVLHGDTEVMRLSADVVAENRLLWRDPDIIPFPEHIVPTGFPGERPNLRVLSNYDVIAHKVSGMYRHGDPGELPWRVQDLVDLLVLSMHERWDGQLAHSIIHEKEVPWGIAYGMNLRMPDRFEVPNPAWDMRFGALAAGTPGLPFRNLNEALPLAKAFLEPLLRPDPLHADWDPTQLRWVPTEPTHHGTGVTSRAPAVEHVATAHHPAEAATGHDRVPSDRPEVSEIEATGDPQPSDAYPRPQMIEHWDALSAGRDDPRSLDARVDAIKARTDKTVREKIEAVRDLLPESGSKPVQVWGLDSPDLRFYADNNGEAPIHAAAVLLNPNTTVEVGYHDGRTFEAYQKAAEASYRVPPDSLPDGLSAADANAAALWRAQQGRSAHDVAPGELVNDLLDLHAQPLRDALAMRRKLMEDFGIEPHRIRIAYDGPRGATSHHREARPQRAHLFTFRHYQRDPIAAREQLVEGLRGGEETAPVRDAHARDVADRLYAAHEPPGEAGSAPKKYAMLWVRDSRNMPTSNHNGLDTHPGVLRDLIETVRAKDPERQIVLVGDDVFARRPELREGWQREGVLDGVDTESMVRFWDAARNGGHRLDLAEQALVFHNLATERDVVQIGMESGALELPYLLHTPTVYLENLVYHMNKGTRWAHAWTEWQYGQVEPMRNQQGYMELKPDGLARTKFRPFGETLPAPLPTVARLQFGPDLPNPKTRQSPVPMDFPADRIAMTSDRINRLVADGELDRWAGQLGRSTIHGTAATKPWMDRDWNASRGYADQLGRWLQVEPATPAEAARKWDAIRLALHGVREPDFNMPIDFEGMHPFAVHTNEMPLQAADSERIARAYATAEPGARGEAVAGVLKNMLGTEEFRWQAVRDLQLFGLAPEERHNLREAIDRVLTARDQLRTEAPADDG